MDRNIPHTTVKVKATPARVATPPLLGPAHRQILLEYLKTDATGSPGKSAQVYAKKDEQQTIEAMVSAGT